MNEESFKEDLAEKLKELRESRNMSLADLAFACRLDVERVGKYESGESLPALGELMSLSRALGVGMGYFFVSELPAEKVEVVRVRDRWTVKPATDAAESLHYSYQSLSYRMTNKMMSPFYIEIPPSEGREVPPSEHDGEEFIFILSGEAEVQIGKDAYELSPGDAMYYDSRTPHTIRALGAQTLTLLVCLVNLKRPEQEDNDPMARAF